MKKEFLYIQKEIQTCSYKSFLMLGGERFIILKAAALFRYVSPPGIKRLFDYFYHMIEDTIISKEL